MGLFYHWDNMSKFLGKSLVLYYKEERGLSSCHEKEITYGPTEIFLS